MTSDSLEDATANFISNPSDNDALLSALEYIRVNNVSLLQIIKALGMYLTSDAKNLRVTALKYLYSILEMNVSTIQQDDVPVLNKFLIARLTDYPSVESSCMCLNSLLKHHSNLIREKGVVMEIMKNIYEQVTVQSLVQTARLQVYSLIATLLEEYQQELAEMGDDFLIGFLATIDGEKDPRNLLLCFRMFQLVSQSLTIDSLAEEMFEFPSCYFPITFRPPPDDPYGISADDLRSELEKCLIANKSFAEYAIPLFMEKVSSTSEPAIEDSMRALVQAIPVFGVDSIFLSNYDDLLKSVQKTFTKDSQDLKASSIAMMKQVFLHSSRDDTLKPLVKSRIAELIDLTFNKFSADVNDAQYLAKCLCEVAETNQENWTQISFRLIPWALEAFTAQEKLSPRLKKEIVVVLSDVLKSCAKLGISLALFDWKSHLESLLIGICKDAETNALKMASKNALLHLCQCLSVIEDFDFIKEVACVFLESEDDEAIKQFGIDFPEVVIDAVTSSNICKERILDNISSISNIRKLVLSHGDSPLFHHCLKYNDSVFPGMMDHLSTFQMVNAKSFGEILRVLPKDKQAGIHLESLEPEFLCEFVINGQPSVLVDKFDYLYGRLFSNDVKSECIAAFVNKTMDDFDDYKNIDIKYLPSITLGLVVKSKGFECLDYLILNSNDVTSMQILFADPTNFLSKSRHSFIRVLYRQRLFTHTVRLLCQRSSTDLKLMGLVLKHIPSQILLSEIDQIYPLLENSLSLNPEELLEKLEMVIQTVPYQIQRYATSLVPKLLEVLSSSDSVRTKILAIKCLSSCAQMESVYVKDLTKMVTQRLVPVLDDRKRLVRKEAAHCRNQWFGKHQILL